VGGCTAQRGPSLETWNLSALLAAETAGGTPQGLDGTHRTHLTLMGSIMRTFICFSSLRTRFPFGSFDGSKSGG
jgi:hypothetical protein